MDKKTLDVKLDYLDSLIPKSDEVFVKPQAKALVIDLSSESSYDWEIPTLYLESYVSGPALGARLWACFVGFDIDLPSSYEADNPVVFTSSAVTNSNMPGGEVLTCTFRSPTTQSLTFNLASNTVGMRLNSLGYCALIITGRLRRPTIISISKAGVSFNTSEVFIGFSISQVENLVETNNARTAMSIGVAGELKVPFSVVVCEGSSLGRGGLGEVFGFKNIKSIVITADCINKNDVSSSNYHAANNLASVKDQVTNSYVASVKEHVANVKDRVENGYVANSCIAESNALENIIEEVSFVEESLVRSEKERKVVNDFGNKGSAVVRDGIGDGVSVGIENGIERKVKGKVKNGVSVESEDEGEYEDGVEYGIENGGTYEATKEAFSRIYRACELSSFCKELKEKGSSYIVSFASKYGWAPVDNFRYRTDPRLFHLSGDETKRRYGTSCTSCTNCPLKCKHITKDGYILPNFESILMLGSNVECFDMDSIMQRYALCIDLGLDPISMGNVLGWLKQAKEQHIVDIIDDNFLFTDNSKVLPAIEMTAKRIGIGEPLSFGTLALSKIFGGEDFAYTIRGLECGPYDYRGAFALSLSHVMGFDFNNMFETVAKLCVKNYANWAIFNENISLGLSSYGVQPALIYPTVIDKLKRNNFYLKLLRMFPTTMMKSLKPKILAECISSVLKKPIQANDIEELGQRTWYLIYEINYALGFDMLEEQKENSSSLLPLHFCIDPNSNSKDSSIVPFFSLLQDYRRLRKQSIVSKISELNKN